MNTRPDGPCILVGDDELEVRQYLEITLNCLGYRVTLAENGNEVLKRLQTSGDEIALVLLDITMPERDGLETLLDIRRMNAVLPVIILAGGYMPINVVAAMKCGATDFLAKPATPDELKKAITRALDGERPDYPRGDRAPCMRTDVFVGVNQQIREIYSLVKQIGWSEAPVLIQGETGTGKEVLARDLHAHSPRADGRFIKLNCAALPSELVESELFGYERGAFTGAFQRKAGMFELADGGTILLDEIGDMAVHLQSKLLQVLQDQQFQRIGGKDMISVDVRVLAATHRDLEKAIADRSFREDLYYRLNVINLVLPSLRERRDDILPLADFLLKKHSPVKSSATLLTLDLKNALYKYSWPGNVRELDNVIRKLIVLRDPDLIARELHMKSRSKALASIAVGEQHLLPVPRPEVNSSAIFEQVTLAKQHAETEAILSALNATRWNRKRAAALLKIDYKALLYKMKKLGVEDSVVPAPAEGREGAPRSAATASSDG
jgi:two-component system response regulator AtoC